MFDFLPAALNFIGGMEQRDQNEELFGRGQDFNSAQAAMNRSFQSQEAATARVFNAEESARNRAFEEGMSNSAYQRAMADMDKAGLNPMLAFMKGGSSTPSGSAGSSGSPSGSTAVSPAAPRIENLASGAISSGMQAAVVSANVEKVKAETELVRAQARNESASPSDNLEDEQGNVRLPSYKVSKIAAEADLTREQSKLVEPTIRKLLNESSHLASGTQVNVHEARLKIAQRLTELVRPGLISAEQRHTIAGAVLQELEAPRARNLANVQSSPWMVKISPYLRDLFTSGASAAAIRSSTR